MAICYSTLCKGVSDHDPTFVFHRAIRFFFMAKSLEKVIFDPMLIVKMISKMFRFFDELKFFDEFVNYFEN